MGFYTIQTGFSRGEIAPQFFDRQDFSGWNYSLKKARNVLITTSAIEVRAGSKFINVVSGVAGQNYKLVKMQYSNDIVYYAVIRDQAIDFYNFFDDSLEQTIVLPYSSADIPDISLTFFSLSLIITFKDIAPEIINFNNSNPAGSKFSRETYTYTTAPQYDYDPTAYSSSSFEILNKNKAGEVADVQITAGSFVWTSDFIGGTFSAQGYGNFNDTGSGKMKAPQTPTNIDLNISSSFGTESSNPPTLVHGEDCIITTNAFNNSKGFPALVGGFQNRVIFASNLGVPTGFWTSETGNPQSFDTGSGLDSNAIIETISEKDVTQIYHLVNNQTIQFATNNGLYVFNTAYAGGLTPSNVNLVSTNKYNYHSGFQPIVYDSMTIGLIEGGRTLIGTQYTGSDNYDSSQINTMSTHICNFPTDAAVLDGQVESVSTLAYFINSDGTLLQYQSQQEEEINGWSLSTTGTNEEDKYRNIVNVDDSILQLVERGDKIVLEKQDFNQRLDSSVIQTGNQFTVVTGLDHLEGRTVLALVTGFDNDGILIEDPDYVVVTDLIVSGGQVTLPYSVDKATVGLFFTPVVTPLEPLIPEGQTGSMFYQRKKRYEVKVSYFNSLGIEILTDTGTIWKQPLLDYEEEAFNAPVLTTDIATFTLGEGWAERLSEFTITQSLPFKFSIKGTTQFVEIEDGS